MSTTRIDIPLDDADRLCATREDPMNAVENALVEETIAIRSRMVEVKRFIFSFAK